MTKSGNLIVALIYRVSLTVPAIWIASEMFFRLKGMPLPYTIWRPFTIFLHVEASREFFIAWLVGALPLVLLVAWSAYYSRAVFPFVRDEVLTSRSVDCFAYRAIKNSKWYGFCLPLNIVTSGSSLEEMKNNLAEKIEKKLDGPLTSPDMIEWFTFFFVGAFHKSLRPKCYHTFRYVEKYILDAVKKRRV